jgi:hypothetical protein
MTAYTAPTEDIKFLIDNVLDFPSHYAKYPSYADATPDMVEMIVTECAKFCETELAPLNQSGDKEGCQGHDS